MKVRTNNVPRYLCNWYDLTEKQKSDMDWRDTEELQDAFLGFVFKGIVYDIQDFTVLDDTNYPVKGWNAAFSTSAFHAVVIKLKASEETVVVGEVFS